MHHNYHNNIKHHAIFALVKLPCIQTVAIMDTKFVDTNLINQHSVHGGGIDIGLHLVHHRYGGPSAQLLAESLMGALLESIASITEGGWTILDWLDLNIHQQSLLVAGGEIMQFLAT